MLVMMIDFGNRGQWERGPLSGAMSPLFYGILSVRRIGNLLRAGMDMTDIYSMYILRYICIFSFPVDRNCRDGMGWYVRAVFVPELERPAGSLFAFAFASAFALLCAALLYFARSRIARLVLYPFCIICAYIHTM